MHVGCQGSKLGILKIHAYSNPPAIVIFGMKTSKETIKNTDASHRPPLKAGGMNVLDTHPVPSTIFTHSKCNRERYRARLSP